MIKGEVGNHENFWSRTQDDDAKKAVSVFRWLLQLEYGTHLKSLPYPVANYIATPVYRFAKATSLAESHGERVHFGPPDPSFRRSGKTTLRDSSYISLAVLMECSMHACRCYYSMILEFMHMRAKGHLLHAGSAPVMLFSRKHDGLYMVFLSRSTAKEREGYTLGGKRRKRNPWSKA